MNTPAKSEAMAISDRRSRKGGKSEAPPRRDPDRGYAHWRHPANQRARRAYQIEMGLREVPEGGALLSPLPLAGEGRRVICDRVIPLPDPPPFRGRGWARFTRPPRRRIRIRPASPR